MRLSKRKIELAIARHEPPLPANALCLSAGMDYETWRQAIYRIGQGADTNPDLAGRMALVLGVDVTDIEADCAVAGKEV